LNIGYLLSSLDKGGFFMVKSRVKMVVVGLLVLAMIMPVSVANAASSDSPVGSVVEASADLSATTVKVSLTTTGWTEVYNDNNWIDVSALLTNDADNGNAVRFRILARTSSSGSYSQISTSPNVSAGLTWTSPLIASSYNRYKVEAQAVSVSKVYSITYNDI
jgi:hypothetical protein